MKESPGCRASGVAPPESPGCRASGVAPPESPGCRASGVAPPDPASLKGKEDSSKEPKGIPDKKPEVSAEHHSWTLTCTERSAHGRNTASIGGRMSIHSFPVFAKEDTVVKGGTLQFVKVKAAIPATALIEPVPLRDEHVKAVPAVYQQMDKIAMINLEKQVTVIKKESR